ncbi:MAG: DotU family type IV/VI secretion system protein [Alphaproteobacteria bacterium]|nr:DotU family type IV/VI secretion system protein [Alphaproteobacteria bacterium]
MTQNTHTAHTSPTLRNFQSFYYEVLRQKEKALRMSDHAVFMETERSTIPEVSLVTEIQIKLRQLIEGSDTNHHAPQGSEKANLTKDAQYIMAALADEIFLNLKWPGVQQWENSLLEAQIFQTQIAGELFFKKLDTLLDANDPRQNDLATLYMMALSLGFRGKYRDTNTGDTTAGDRIKGYRAQIYTTLNHRPATLSHPGKPHLIDQCYNNTILSPPGRGLPDARVWTVCILGLLTAYVFVTYVVWYKLAAEMHEVLGLIFEQTRQAGSM